MKLEWSPLAIADREEIFGYIAVDNPSAAVAFDERISERLGMLIEFPESGRTGRIAGTRELVITGTPYIAAYRINDSAVLVLRVLHAARVWPDEMGSS